MNQDTEKIKHLTVESLTISSPNSNSTIQIGTIFGHTGIWINGNDVRLGIIAPDGSEPYLTMQAVDSGKSEAGQEPAKVILLSDLVNTIRFIGSLKQ